MLEYAEPVTKLIDEFKRLPGVGQKSAQRLAFHVMKMSQPDVERFVAALEEVKRKIIFCTVCNNLTDVDPCRFCASTSREHNLVSVEKTRSYHGLYHVLHGSLSPLRGMSPEDLRLANLLPRLRPDNNDGVEVREVILATNPNTEGEATASYVSRLLKPLGVRVTRIAMGMPVGSDLEYVDEVTMDKALANRHEM
ncbi:MAG: recombination mediator RecR [Acidobacteria bacterium]|nr:recombination mediator RecR [Acidobacteriota bacterium]